ncbi:hypothetical protein G7046_g4451 [Stylonectria norvegica]|nr:hypothetical protein G7046_g4451 [Stylonectria norvegica]
MTRHSTAPKPRGEHQQSTSRAADQPHLPSLQRGRLLKPSLGAPWAVGPPLSLVQSSILATHDNSNGQWQCNTKALDVQWQPAKQKHPPNIASRHLLPPATSRSGPLICGGSVNLQCPAGSSAASPPSPGRALSVLLDRLVSLHGCWTGSMARSLAVQSKRRPLDKTQAIEMSNATHDPPSPILPARHGLGWWATAPTVTAVAHLSGLTPVALVVRLGGLHPSSMRCLIQLRLG